MTVRLVEKATFALCRVSKAQDGASWYHTLPEPGEYPGMTIREGGEDRPDQTIVIAAEDYPVILAAFKRDQADPAFHGLLVDREHFSLESGQSSEASAWAEDMRIDPDGIWTRWTLTALGKQLLDGDMYRGRSPVFHVEPIPGRPGCWRIIRLTGIGLTNTPFFENLSPDARARRDNQGGAAMLLDKLRARLKLDAAADEQAVLAAVSTVLDKGDADATALAAARARVTELETAQRERDWDAFAAANKDRIADSAVVKARFLADPEGTKALISATKSAAAPQAEARRIGQGAQTPGGAAREAEPKLDRAEVRRQAAQIARETGCSKSTALCRAERNLRSKQQKGS